MQNRRPKSLLSSPAKKNALESNSQKPVRLQAPRGTKDILPVEAAKWRAVERAVDEVGEIFGFGEIRTPSFENVRLFKRAVGEETDIISKEMYELKARGEETEEFALRPELTAPVVRAAIEHGMLTGQSDCVRLYYRGAANFRYEKPQLGRLRQHHQFGTELLGPASPLADAETISFAIAVFRRLGLRTFRVRLNSLGSAASRERWRGVLVPYLRQHIEKLSKDSQRRTETNPLRVLDSKSAEDLEIVRNAPRIFDYFGDEDKAHFEALQQALRTAGIEYVIDPLLVRGIDYYTSTVFEVTSPDLGSQDALCGGGRYDHLVEQLGGPATPAVGFGAGIERLLIALEKVETEAIASSTKSVYIVTLGAAARPVAFRTAGELRVLGITAMYDLHDNRSMKAQMREANRAQAAYTYIIGDSELAENAGVLKDMASGEQEKVPFQDIAARMGNGVSRATDFILQTS
jgi:histidyl-tRNA synthetase